MSTPSRFPPLDPAAYAWKPSSNVPNQWLRRALGGETLWIPRPKDYHQMFIGGALTLGSPTLRSVVDRAVKCAWRRLRFDVPELAVSGGYGQDNNAYMLYEVPQSDDAVDHWVKRTSCLECGKTRTSVEELLEKVRQKTKGHASEQVFLFLNLVVEDDSDLVTKVDFMLNADHQVTDGIGIRIIIGRFFALLAQSLHAPATVEERLDWKESVTNLSPPWIQVVNEQQVLSGPDYEQGAEANEEIIFQQMPQNPGLPLLPIAETPTQKTHFITISTHQTAALLRNVKSIINPSSNITHLGHAAMVLALLRSNRPTYPSQRLFSPCWLNGRRYLKPSPSLPKPPKSYIPICQSFAPIVFSGLDHLNLKRSATNNEIREVLGKACREATEEYGRIRKRESMLPECVVMFERLGKNMFLKGILETPLAPATGRINTASDQQDVIPVRTADPFFLSDGITEQYIDHVYFDQSSRKVFEVDNIMIKSGLADQTNRIVRMSNWRGSITVSGEWKECDYDGAMIVAFLKDMVEIMLSITE
ncbi:Core trichothecene cluster (CTC) 3 [Hyphodiscus hymeniophilus]|uniref:Core trichothecene cluster (CTC) 3 n=1 Tax=Hyphodiscus hymeniophilus TaxID=353542 RepID=A0A9P6VDC5_9HELO|nr:Core trichothecene cluster (CTC) 3 [Hyphodiscus hymeniophilus]